MGSLGDEAPPSPAAAAVGQSVEVVAAEAEPGVDASADPAATAGSIGEFVRLTKPARRAGGIGGRGWELPDTPLVVWARDRAQRVAQSEAAARVRSSPLASEWAPRSVLALAIVIFVGVFVPLVVKQQNHYGTFDFDLGVFDQATWLLAHGRGFITIRGLPFLGHHLNFGLYLFAPAYWLGAGPKFLCEMMILSYAAGAVVLTRIARYYHRNEWYGVLLAVAFIFHDSVQNQINQAFHPEAMAVPFILGAVLCALHRRWRWFALMIFMTLIWKEDLSLWVVMIGLAIAWKRSIRIGAITAAVGAAYFVIATRFLMPHFIPGGPFYGNVMGPIGRGPFQWLDNAVGHPALYRTAFTNNHGASYGPKLAIPFGLTSVLSPGSLLLAAPILFVNLFSAEGYTGDVFRQYAVVPLLMMAVAAVRGLLSRRRVAVRLGLCVLVVLGSLSTINVGSGPWSHRYKSGIWTLTATPRTHALDRAVAMIPGQAPVAASYFIVPHLSHRPDIYTFPNPWSPENWGVNDQHPRSGATVEWILVDEATVVQDPKQVALLARLQSSQFTVAFRSEQIELLHRVAPGT